MAEVKYGYISADTFTNIAAAIREKNGSDNTYLPSEMPDAIRSISTGIDTSEATATVGDIVEGKTAFGSNGLLMGNLKVINLITGATSPNESIGSVGDAYLSGSKSYKRISTGWSEITLSEFSTLLNGKKINQLENPYTTADSVGEININSNDILLDSSVPSGTYTLRYEDENDIPLDGWVSIGTITK